MCQKTLIESVPVLNNSGDHVIQVFAAGARSLRADCLASDIGIGLVLFGVSRRHWQEWSGFVFLAAGIALVLHTSITGDPAL